jgi:tetrapyrrole methylase family protein/MazG family protein
LEETYEVLQAIDDGQAHKLLEELGDLLLQVVFHAQLASEGENFDINDVVQGIVDKLVRRHPHVFGEVEVDGSAEVLANWESIKRRERESEKNVESSGDDLDSGDHETSLLDGIPQSLPALSRAFKLQKRAASVGFDWDRIGDVVEKVEEEAAELRKACSDDDARAVYTEFGDLLFALVNLSRFLGIRPEFALGDANSRFERRFRHIERRVAEIGANPEELTLAELDELWEEAKTQE